MNEANQTGQEKAPKKSRTPQAKQARRKKTPCRVPNCPNASLRWYGWNTAKKGESPNLVKAPLCADHARHLRRVTGGGVIALGKGDQGKMR